MNRGFSPPNIGQVCLRTLLADQVVFVFWATRWLRCARHAVSGYSLLSRFVIPAALPLRPRCFFVCSCSGQGTGRHTRSRRSRAARGWGRSFKLFLYPNAPASGESGSERIPVIDPAVPARIYQPVPVLSLPSLPKAISASSVAIGPFACYYIIYRSMCYSYMQKSL